MTDSRRGYVYLDLGYVRRIYEDVMLKVLDEKGDLDVATFGLLGEKIYVYDCEPEQKASDESDTHYQSRLTAADDYLSALELLDKVQLRCGRLKPRRRQRPRQQKRVDVQIAVDMLSHTFRSGLTHAILIAGDDDFTPLVSAVVDAGVDVTVAVHRSSYSRDLLAAADRHDFLSSREIRGWTSHERLLQLPALRRAKDTQRLKTAPSYIQAGRTRFAFVSDGKKHQAWEADNASKIMEANDRELLQRWVEHDHGKINSPIGPATRSS